MAKNIKVNNVTYNSVDSISIPLAAGGGNAVFPDTSDANAAAGDIASGKTAYVNGSKITGTASGSGGGGEYTGETGSYEGTGTYNDYSSLVFSGNPVAVVIYDYYESIGVFWLSDFDQQFPEGFTLCASYGTAGTMISGDYLGVTMDNNQLWWMSTTSAETQLNIDGNTYYYIAIVEA